MIDEQIFSAENGDIRVSLYYNDRSQIEINIAHRHDNITVSASEAYELSNILTTILNRIFFEV